MNTTWSVLIVVFFCLTQVPQTAVQGSHTKSSVQTHFSAEETNVKRPVTIPEDVLAILKKVEMVRRALEDQNSPADKLLRSWFSASAIHLSSPEKTDFIVVGNPPLSGANVATFWIFRATEHGHELVLMTPAHDLIVRNTRWRNYREIELWSATAVEVSTVLFRFDGKQYKVHRTKSEPIR